MKIKDSGLFGSQVFYHGLLPFEQIHDIQQSADYLITFGSNNPNMIPCKIFEYFSTFRPVINVYNSPYDSAKPYVEKYWNKIQLYTGNSIDENKKILADYINKNFECTIESGRFGKNILG